MNIMKMPDCYSKSPNGPEVYCGVPTFLGVPVVHETQQLENFDAAVLGVPWEGPITWGKFSGCELSTKSIREAALRYGGFLPEYGYDFFDHLAVCDVGDVSVTPGSVEQTFKQIKSKAAEVFETDTVPIIFGGDHSISEPILEALIEKYPGKVGLLHLDAHMDNLDSFGAEKHARCCPFARVYEHKDMDSTKIVHMGIRGPRNSYSQMARAKEVGAHIITGLEIKMKGVEQAIEQAWSYLKGAEAVYVSVCSDILDVAFNPGGPPDMNGLSSYELSRILYESAKRGIKGFDFVEIYPLSDPKGVSSHVAAWMSVYTLSGIAANRMDNKG